MMNPKTLQEAVIFFDDSDNCLNYFISRRWPNGVICPNCGRDDVTFLTSQKKWQCKSSHKQRQFSAKVGTIFEDSPLGLCKWLLAVWMVTNCKNGVSSYEISRHIGVTQKTAWFMAHRIRVAMTTSSFEKFSGEVEADETFIGGKGRNMHQAAKIARKVSNKGGAAHMTSVMGVIQRRGRVRATITKTSGEKVLREIIDNYVERGSHLYTDQARQFQNLGEDYIHWVINHSYEYVRENVHTNSIENFWSLLKRTIRGTYVSVAPEHLQKYIEEQTFRFNERKGTDGERFHKVTSQFAGKRLTYAELTGKTPEAYKLSL